MNICQYKVAKMWPVNENVKANFILNTPQYVIADTSRIPIHAPQLSHKLHGTQYTPQLETLFTNIAGHLKT
jgi:hypothetical protein